MKIYFYLLLGCFILSPISNVLSAKEQTYEGLSEFAKVIDLVERNYVDSVDSKELTTNAIIGMLGSLDPYSVYLSSENFKEVEIGTSGEFGGIGVEITIKNGILTVITPIEEGPAEKAGIKAGDVILSIDGNDTQFFTTEKASKVMRGAKGTTVELLILSEGDKDSRKINVTRDIIKVKSVSSKLIENQFGYIKLSQFSRNSTDEFLGSYNELKSKKGSELKGLIIDLRNNPGGLLDQAIELSNLFIDKGLIVSVRGRFNNTSREYFAEDNSKISNLPLVILVNQGSASASEVLAGALKDNRRAKIVGKTTFGKGSVQSIIELGDGTGIKITTAKFYTASGKTISEVGITPDIV
ncbi:MAG: S41 family peptidase, partial [Thermodesulfobacteriota bacterium]